MKTIILLLLAQSCVLSAFGQKNLESHWKIQYVEVPREQVLVVLVYQPNCPLRIEEASCLFRIDKRKTIIRYRVRNVSSKPISDFTVTSWDLDGGGGTLPVLMTGSEGLLRPGQSLDSLDSANSEVLSMTIELREQVMQNARAIFEGKMRHSYFLIVDQVGFADGSMYKDQRVSQSLSDHLSEHDCGSES